MYFDIKNIIFCIAPVDNGFRPNAMVAMFSGDGLLVGKLSMTTLCLTAYGNLIPLALIDGSENYDSLQVTCLLFFVNYF